MMGLIPRDYWKYSISDVFRGFNAIWKTEKIRDTIHVLQLGEGYTVRSGRAGLFVALKALELPPGAKIGVPLYCCHVVFEAIAQAGYTPYFIDIDADNFCISAEDLHRKRSEIETIVAVHTFGNLCNIPQLQSIIGDKPIIEDCAQALGSKLNNKMVGSFGKIAFFSFRSGKYLSAGEGGALFTNDRYVEERIARMIRKMPSPYLTDECIQIARTYTKSALRSRPLYGLMGYFLWNNYSKKSKPASKSKAIISQIYRADLEIIRKRMVNIEKEIERQRSNAAYYSRALKLAPKMICEETPDAFYNRYFYPITFSSTELRNSIAAYLLKRKIDTIKYLDNIVDIAAQLFGYNGGCPVAEQLSKRVLIIPSYHSLKEEDVKRIAQCLNAGWAEIAISGQDGLF